MRELNGRMHSRLPSAWSVSSVCRVCVTSCNEEEDTSMS
jgi:hypothetical protein